MPESDRTAIEARVRAFIADHFAWEDRWCRWTDGVSQAPLCPADLVAQWQEHSEKGPQSPADRLAALVEAAEASHQARPKIAAFLTLACHWAEGTLSTQGADYHSTGHKHHPEHESITGCLIQGDEAEVDTLLAPPEHWPTSYAYSLVRSAGEWKIVKLREMVGSRDDFPPAAANLSGAELPGQLSFVGQSELDLEQAFQAQTIQASDRLISIQVERAGKLTSHSGCLVAADCGDFSDAVPFAAKVLPGEYEVILSRDGAGSVGAAKLVIRPGEPAVAFVPAKLIGETGDDPTYLPVDGGSLGFADAATALAQNTWNLGKLRWRFFESMCERQPQTDAAFASIANDGCLDAVCISSGHGDGGYACYWGLGADGMPVCLVADFAVFGSVREWSRTLPFGPALFGDSLADAVLAEHGLAVRIWRDGAAFAITEKGRKSLRGVLSDAAGNVIADTDRSGSMDSHEGATKYLRDVPEDLAGGNLTLRWTTWEHAFSRKLNGGPAHDA